CGGRQSAVRGSRGAIRPAAVRRLDDRRARRPGARGAGAGAGGGERGAHHRRVNGMFACLHLPASFAAGEASPVSPLLSIAGEFSPRYESHGDRLVVIDVSGLERLLGPAPAIGEELRRAAARRGLRAHVAIASTQTAARVLAIARPGLTIVPPGG